MVQYNDDEKPLTPNADVPAGSRDTRGLVTLQPVKYSKDDVSLGEDTVTAEVELRATSSTAMREGLDLVMVLDVGDDMAGARMEEIKKAMRFVLMKLTPADRLSVVTFSDEVKRACPLLTMTSDAKDELKVIVDDLEAGGNKLNILIGLQIGQDVIGHRVHKEGRTAAIFLVSAGYCTDETMEASKAVDTSNVAVYTFGLGNSEEANRIHWLLADLSRGSLGGTFNWVPDGTSLSAAFSQPLAGLLTVVAQDVEVTLTPRTEDPKARDLDKMELGLYESEPTTDSATGAMTLKFGALFSGESRKVLVNLTLSRTAAAGATRYDAELADVQHSYTAQGIAQGPRAPQLIQIRRSPNPSGAEGTSSRARQLRAELARREHTRVFVSAVMQTYYLYTWYLGGLSRGHRERVRYEIVAAQNALEDIVLDDGMEEVVGMLRAELRQQLALLHRRKPHEAYKAKGAPYAYASISSHGGQRFAARGSDIDAIRLFSTPRMDTYLQQAREFDKDPDTPLPNADDDAKNEAAHGATKT